MTPPTLTDLARWLGAELDEPEPLRRDGPAEVRRLALALEPTDLPPTLEADALFLHRSRRVGNGWPGLGVLAAHDGFDTHLTTGPNHRLARVLGWTEVEEVVWEGRVVGISATPPQRGWASFRAALHAELGGEDTSWSPEPPSGALRLALMNAMNPALIGHVAGLGVRVYLTGQLRPSAVGAAREQGLGVVALGHRRTELWALRRLARELEGTFPGLETRVYGA
ncbi:putative NIF3 family GTP cyclohydrolase 1 type 2 [Deinococcus sp. HSC-46F16]|uniref:Nif3-like dinuclear metal center hexameric protein n=1 Tax=Deinococcus sp. HSC-46F16 TaxID=2910968 RepID=UPI00209CC5DA|nr:Nif3-like dinuclear metal center hexameric protein [Deinococcus sp. HSC-46F16]MCP2013961.1 putative NIF3 family GTP cyclohydrolase 1 type 2 [Deinococcus sp. HSC-46F16]